MTDTTGAPVAARKRTRKVNPPPPDLDFGKLAPAKTTPPPTARGKAKADNPTIPWLAASWNSRKRTGQINGRVVEEGEWHSVTVPNANVQQVKNLLNYAARDLRVGVAFHTKEMAAGKTKISYQAKTRKQQKPKAVAPPTVPTAP